MARELQAELCLFLSQSLRNHKCHLCLCRGDNTSSQISGCRWLCSFTFPVSAASGIAGCCFSYLNHRNNTSGYFPPFSIAAWIHHLLPPDWPRHFHDKRILPAGGQSRILACLCCRWHQQAGPGCLFSPAARREAVTSTDSALRHSAPSQGQTVDIIMSSISTANRQQALFLSSCLQQN